MAHTPVERYVWIVDTLRRRGRLTRRQLNDLWKQSVFCTSGEDLSRRTFYNYRNAILMLFDIEIEYDTVTREYYINESKDKGSNLTDWLLNSAAVNEALVASSQISDRILLEEVPSAVQLPVVFNALKTSTRLKFDYYNFTRSRPTADVMLEPYLARIFKQRWYVIGRNVKDNKLKTYALDRMQRVIDTGETFETPEGFTPDTYFQYSFGIVVNRSAPRDITLRTDHHYAKYLAALPLHPSQEQVIHDQYCIFKYKMQITDDLVQELLGHGSRIVVEEPRELRVRMIDELTKSIDAYQTPPVYKSILKKSDTLPVTDIGEINKRE